MVGEGSDEEPLRLRARDLASREFAGESVVLDLASSTYLQANEAGTLLWRALEAGTTRGRLVGALVEAFAVPEETARADVDAFLADVRHRGLLDAR